MTPRTDRLNAWEKAAIFTTGAGGAFNILLYQLGYALADAIPSSPWLWGARVFFAVVSFVGFDLTLGVTVMAMRAGRRSLWAGVTVGVALLAAGGIALDVSAVWHQPWMHAAPPMVLAAFMLHLAAPPIDQRPRALAQRADQAEAAAAQLQLEIDLRDETIGQLRRDLETALSAMPAMPHGMDHLLPDATPMVASMASGENAAVALDKAMAAFSCPSCGAALSSHGEYGAARRWGRCKYCKGEA